jgi:UDPglucose--hexose-1-phosphate uridylyltransferase
VKRTAIELADGRELIYFDERDDAVRGAADKRTLDPPPPAAQLRYDPLTDEWVAVAAHRQTRPFLPAADACPLCPSTADWLSEVPADDYEVVVFENRFPSFSDRIAAAGPPNADIGDGDAVGMRSARPAFGRCEVVCFTPEHTASFRDLPVDRVRTVLDALADRTAELSAIDGVEQVFCFENRGVEIGVTMHHPHGQIYAYPYTTPTTRTYLRAARRHTTATSRNLYADLLAAERAAGVRVVAGNEHWTAFVPFAARWPYEIHLAPHRQVADLAELTDAERDSCAPLWTEIVRRLDGLFGVDMPYVAAWHQAPVHADRELGYLHLQLYTVRRAPGKLKYLAGSESAMGAWVNDVPPEAAAAALRAVTL